MKHKSHTLLAAFLALPLVSFGTIVGPYATDAFTLHLWQFNETAGSTTTADNGSAATLRALTAETIDGSGNASTTQSGAVTATGLTGFGNAANTNAGSNDGFRTETMMPNGSGDLTGADGAFTFEAIIKTSNINSEQILLAMDGNGTNRSFLFRIMNTGELRFNRLQNSSFSVGAQIPTGLDPNAWQADAWYHIAVTYDGVANTADNTRLFWTKMDNARTEANQLAAGQMSNDLDARTLFLGIGNEYRPAPAVNLDGLIDEVRISSIARGADQMMFTIPEPGTFALMGLALAALALSRRRR